DGEPVGYIRAGSYGWTLGSAVGLAMVEGGGAIVTPDWLAAGSWEGDIAGTRHPAQVSLRPMYDPPTARVRTSSPPPFRPPGRPHRPERTCPLPPRRGFLLAFAPACRAETRPSVRRSCRLCQRWPVGRSSSCSKNAPKRPSGSIRCTSRIQWHGLPTASG